MSRLKISAFLLAIAGVSIPTGAHAHFVLQAPMNWARQDSQGLPEKSAPCGQADPMTAAVATNMITAYAPGDTVTITIMETTPHPGHYRVVLSPTGQSGLPADPAVTPDSASACGTTTIQNPAVYPVLADGMLQHTGVMSGARSFTVTLPTNVTCTKCSLQVQEFMSNHPLNNPGGCWYHHCADISIQTGTGGAGGRGGAGGGAGTGGAAGMAGRGGAGGGAGRGGAGGTGGASGAAGATGTAGGSGTIGTAGGSGAVGTAGTTGTAGASATAGSSGTTGAAGNVGQGGTTAAGSAGSGGTTATGRGGNNGSGGSGTSGSGVDAGPPGGGDSGGGCAVGDKNISLSALFLVLVAFASRRRARRR